MNTVLFVNATIGFSEILFLVNAKFDFGQQEEDIEWISKCKPTLYNIVYLIIIL